MATAPLRDANSELKIDAYRAVFQVCIAAVGDQYIFTMINYAAELSDGVAGEKIFKFIESVLINKTAIIMTYGQQLRQEAIQRDRLAIARTMLKDKESKEKVIKWTGLTPKQIETLHQELAKS